MDRISREHRSWNMSRIRGRDTKPEVAVRSVLHRLGLRFRLHRRDLPGRPDIVLARHRTVVFGPRMLLASACEMPLCIQPEEQHGILVTEVQNEYRAGPARPPSPPRTRLACRRRLGVPSHRPRGACQTSRCRLSVADISPAAISAARRPAIPARRRLRAAPPSSPARGSRLFPRSSRGRGPG